MADIKNARRLLKKYKDARAQLTGRIVQNERWYRMRHTELISDDRYIPASAWLFNSLAVKHADAMEAIPHPCVLAREPSDTQSAEALSRLLPVIMERSDFPAVYSAIWNDKLRHGTGVYGVFWNPTENGGLGDIDVRRVDVLNLFWEAGVNDINASPNLFHCELKSIDEIMELYPKVKELSSDNPMECGRYLYDDTVDVSDKATVVDWYYKKHLPGGKTVLHYCKFVGETELYCTEDYPEFEKDGLYAHGKYPFVFDVMYPIEGTPCGFGALDIMKDAQLQIDKLGYAILENAKMAATRRYFIRADGSVNEDEFADWTRPFVHIQGAGLGQDSIREITVEPLSDIYLEVINNKITELKETSGNRDVTSGGSEHGVTAAAAITALQESGGKMTSDMIASSYRAFCKVCNLTVELIRQFYTAPRVFRVIGKNGTDSDYLTYDNAMIGGEELIKKPAFDISIKAEKSIQNHREERNAMATKLYEMGIFEPAKREEAKILLKMMDFEGKDELLLMLEGE